MKILVVEPHCDDAFLSLGYHLETLWKGVDRTILTVYPKTTHRVDEARAYAKAIGADSIDLPVGLTDRREIRTMIMRVYEEVKPTRVFLPLGVQHEEHLAVSEMVVADGYYLDTPYQLKLKNQEAIQKKLHGRAVLSFAAVAKRKWRHIPLFKSQSMFFRNNPIEYLNRAPEVIVK